MTAITIPNTFVPSTTISSTEMNANFQAVADAIEDSLALDGTTPMTGQLRLVNGTAAAPSMTFDTDPNTGVFRGGADDLAFTTAGTQAWHIDSGGRLVSANAAAITIGGHIAAVQALATDTGGSSFFGVRFSADASGPTYKFGKSRNAAVGGQTVVQSGDALGTIIFTGSDGTAQRDAASISAAVDGTPGSGDMPGRLVFSTSADGSATPTERLRIGADGQLQFAAASFAANGAGTVTISNLRPGGAATATITRWLTFKDEAGVDSYIPVWQ